MRMFLLAMLAVTVSSAAQARDQIRIVGSSTVFPFVAAVSERYADNTGAKAPIVESIGTGAGMIEFCKGTGVSFPDMVSASRQIMSSERKDCEAHHVGEIIEVSIGSDGIVLASSIEGQPFPLTRESLFLALARQIPSDEGSLMDNPYKTWQQVSPDLPNLPIEVYGPKSTSGTRDAFVELVMEPVCMEFQEFVDAYADEKERKNACHAIREDGAYIEAGENDNLIVQKLTLNPKALGIFGFGYLDTNMDKIMAHSIDGVEPDFDHIADGSYPVARGLYVYVKRAHLDAVKGMREFLAELTGEDALGDDGYLVDKGLIPLPQEQRDALHKRIGAL